MLLVVLPLLLAAVLAAARAVAQREPHAASAVCSRRRRCCCAGTCQVGGRQVDGDSATPGAATNTSSLQVRCTRRWAPATKAVGPVPYAAAAANASKSTSQCTRPPSTCTTTSRKATPRHFRQLAANQRRHRPHPAARWPYIQQPELLQVVWCQRGGLQGPLQLLLLL